MTTLHTFCYYEYKIKPVTGSADLLFFVSTNINLMLLNLLIIKLRLAIYDLQNI